MVKTPKSRKVQVQKLRDKVLAPLIDAMKNFPNLTIERTAWEKGVPIVQVVFTVSETFINNQVEVMQQYLRNNRIGVTRAFNFNLLSAARYEVFIHNTLEYLDEDLQAHIKNKLNELTGEALHGQDS